MKIQLKLSIILITLPLFMASSIAQSQVSEVFSYFNNKEWQKAEELARSCGNKPLLKIVLSEKLLDENYKSNNFEAAIQFIHNNPHWPGNRNLKEKAESYLNYNTNQKIIFAWFNGNKPQTSKGYKFYALASAKFIQDQSTLASIIRNGWIYGDFTSEEEKKYYHDFHQYLRPGDHLKRIDEHLWRANILEARRSLHLVSKDYQKTVKAAIASIQKDPAAEELFNNVPETKYIAGLLFHYLKYKEKDEPDDKIVKIFAKFNKDQLHGHALWRLQAYYAREFIKQKDYQSAYKIASKSLATRAADVSDQEFLAGWLALQFLKKPDVALTHFNRFNQIVKQPISKARGAYWLGRSFEAKGDSKQANNFYQKASKYSYTFYGQVASTELKQDKIILPSKPKAEIAHKKNIENNEIVIAAKLLIKYGMPDLGQKYAKVAISQASNKAEMMLIADIIKSNDHPYYMVEVAKTACQNHTFIKDYAFPTPYQKTLVNSPVENALTYSIIRQESVFNQSAVSTAKAMGLMQLIKTTACSTAKAIAVKCNITRLTKDPAYNILLGTHQLKQLLKERKGSYILAIASYNTASHNVDKWIKLFGDPRTMKNLREIIDWLELIPFYETRNYLQRIFENIQVYRSILDKSNKLRLKEDLMRSEI